ncbi:MAG: tRNA lysidine(34) synthetase TilS [Armatimonadetes bacterium]|nr:tRNA lysidine(34) synthetase TilS [Armatimonadota bacterium]
MSTFLDKVRKTIARFHMVKPWDGILVAVSGGPDSMCMLHVLTALAPSLNLSLSVFHLNHRSRPESSSDARFVRAEARRMGFPFVLASCDVPAHAARNRLSFEDAARRIRYKELVRAARKEGKNLIATGHTADDQAETVLLHLLRGSALTGLGIPPVRGSIIRPLLEVTRAEVLTFCQEKGIPYITDETNLALQHDRNRVRWELLPLLEKEYNPRVRKHLCKMADLAWEERQVLQQLASEVFHKIVQDKEEGMVSLSIAGLLEVPLAIQRRALRLALEIVKGDLEGVGFDHIENMLEIVHGTTGKRLIIPGKVQCEKIYDRLFVTGGKKRRKILEELRPRLIESPGRTEAPEWGIAISAEIFPREDLPKGPFSPPSRIAYFDESKVRRPIWLRRRRPGDRFQPFGMEGTKKIKDFLMDEKVDPRLRDRIPLVVSGEDILWVVGLRTDERFRIGKETQKILCLKVEEYA